MRIVTWNMDHWHRRAVHREAWRFLSDVVQADVALVQEAVPPTGLEAVYRPIGDRHREWGSAVVALNPRYSLRARTRRSMREALGVDELHDSHPGTTAVADVVDTSSQKVRFVAVSFYGMWEYLPPDTDKPDATPAIYSTTTCHRLVSDLTPLLVGARNMHRTPVLLAGDFNATTQIAAQTHWQVERDETRVLFDRLDVLGLHDLVARTRDTRKRLDACSCPKPTTCSHVQTYRSRNGTLPTQLDYVFTSEQLASNAKCEVFDREDAWALSDHCPIVIDLPDG